MYSRVNFQLLLLLAFALALALAFALLLALATLGGIEESFSHIGLSGYLTDGQCHRLLWSAQLDLNGVLFVLRLGLAAQLDEEHIAVRLIARFVAHL